MTTTLLPVALLTFDSSRRSSQAPAEYPAPPGARGAPVHRPNAVRYAEPAQHRPADVLDAARLLRPVDRRRPALASGG
ncbi:hypothetical protein [Streptomyces sp. NBC_00637]|uniref:hypothetical protein n=1 Tax=Streptomyces sp. NBC_00637 TaxID=2903667 RepID=UPI0038701688